MSGRGRTGRGRPAPLPAGAYQPAPAIGSAQGLAVSFTGEDGRAWQFDVASLPLPGWHNALAAGWAARTGPVGSVRTRASARGSWSTLKMLMTFLSERPRPPAEPERLTAGDLEAFRRHREASIGTVYASREMRDLRMLFLTAPMADRVPSAALEVLLTRGTGRPTPKPGYSDGELARIVTAARSEVAQLRQRLTATSEILRRYEQDPGELTLEERDRAATLKEVARTGVTGVPLTQVAQTMVARRHVASQVFVTRRDLMPILVLMVVVTGWNVETIKELPAEHRVIEGVAVELQVTKRRRGSGRWHSTVTWEIGPPSRELHTPGGLYLLLHRLMQPGRDLAGTPALWAVWHNRRTPVDYDEGCRNPFADNLSRQLSGQQWIRSHALQADALNADKPADPAAQAAPAGMAAEPGLLRLDFNRLKTSAEVRRTRQLGGHLPSAVRTNTMPVLFTNYLRGDPTTIEWAQGIMSDALTDVEQSAWAAHRAALEASGRTTLDVVAAGHQAQGAVYAGPEPGSAPGTKTGPQDTAWTACRDHGHHPVTGRGCKTLSFLDCFHCANCLVTHDHLPGLLGLLEALEGRLAVMQADAWWGDYGPVWAAVRYDVLPNFSPAEVDQAFAARPLDSLLDLVEPRRERP